MDKDLKNKLEIYTNLENRLEIYGYFKLENELFNCEWQMNPI